MSAVRTATPPATQGAEPPRGTRYFFDFGQVGISSDGPMVAHRDYAELFTGLQAIIDRSLNGEPGTSKVIDMRNIALALLASHGGRS